MSYCFCSSKYLVLRQKVIGEGIFRHILEKINGSRCLDLVLLTISVLAALVKCPRLGGMNLGKGSYI